MNSLRTVAGVVAVMLAVLAGTAPAATNTYLVGSGQTYSTVQSALDAARTGGSAGDTQIVRIMDSGSYANEDLTLSATTETWGTRKLSLEADAGQTPILYRILLAKAIGEVTLKGLKFKSPKAGATVNGGVEITQNGGTLTAPITIANCNFEQTGNAAGQGWLNGVYIRASASATFGKITVASCNFDMTAAATGLNARGITFAYVNNYANVEVYDCLFLGGMHGVFDDCNKASPSMVALNVHHNLFLSQNFNGFGKSDNITASIAYLTVENNTFVKVCDRVNSYGSGGAIGLRGSVAVTGVIKDNLIVDDDTSTANAGLGWYSTVATECNADTNAFVAMTANKVAAWGGTGGTLRTIAELNLLTGASGNFEKNANGSAGDPTLANLFANYGGTNYRNDYKLKAGVWALTAASDGSYVGAFGAVVPSPARGTAIYVR